MDLSSLISSAINRILLDSSVSDEGKDGFVGACLGEG